MTETLDLGSDGRNRSPFIVRMNCDTSLPFSEEGLTSGSPLDEPFRGLGVEVGGRTVQKSRPEKGREGPGNGHKRDRSKETHRLK